MSPTVGVVTGAARGMGHACARHLASTVDVLVVVDLDEAALQAAASELSADGRRVEPLVMDVTDADDLRELAARVSTLGSLRSVAHAAGISPTMGDWRRILTVDLVGTARLVDVLQPLVVPGTAMVCFASMAAQIMLPIGDPAGDAVIDKPLDERILTRMHAAVGSAIDDSGVAYAWAKRGVQRLVQRQAMAWGPAGGRIVSVSPGIVDTPQARQELEQQEAMAGLLALTPVGRMGEAEEVAAVVAFLLSDQAAFVTGCDVLVDGGVCAALSPRSAATPGPADVQTLTDGGVGQQEQLRQRHPGDASR